jgi:hypothetical protein
MAAAAAGPAQTFWPEIGQSVFVLPNVRFVKKVNGDDRLKFQGVWGIQSHRSVIFSSSAEKKGTKDDKRCFGKNPEHQIPNFKQAPNHNKRLSGILQR